MLNERSKQIRRDLIKLMYEHKGSHYGGSLSCVEILIALYDHVMTKDDVFLLSKGHACWALYTMLRDKGLNPEINHHPKYDPANGIHMTSGSLGHGIPFGIGVALAKKIKKEDGCVYVLCGEGDVQEGTFWESLLVAGYQKLNNLIVMIDANKIQGSDFVDNTIPIHALFISASDNRWYCGIDFSPESVLCKTLPNLWYNRTIKGRGVSFMENKPEWHSRVLTESEYNQALQEL